MSQFVRLSDLLHQLHQRLQDFKEPLKHPLRQGASLLAVDQWGNEILRTASLINVAGLALSQERLTVHFLDKEAIDQVNETDVRAIPAEPPRLLARGWSVETSHLGQPLYDNVVCLGGYSIEGQHWLIAESVPDGVSVGRWVPKWGEKQDVEAAYWEEGQQNPFVDLGEEHEQVIIHGIRFALTLGALLDAEGTPLVVSREPQQSFPTPTERARGMKKPLSWSLRRVSLDPEKAYGTEEAPAGESRPAGDRSGLKAEKRQVRGFLRRQPHGPGRTERKWVYIASFTSTRYVSERPLKVVVEGRKEETS